MKKVIPIVSIIGLLLSTSLVFAQSSVTTNWVFSGGTLNIQQSVAPVYSGSGAVTSNLLATGSSSGLMTTQSQPKNYWCGDREVGSQSLATTGSGLMLYTLDYIQVSDYGFISDSGATGVYSANVQSSWANRGKLNGGANIAVAPGAAYSQLFVGSSWAYVDLLTSGSGYLEMRSNTEDWGNNPVVSGIPTTHRAFGEISVTGPGQFTVQAYDPSIMDYKVVGIADGISFTTKADNISGGIIDFGSFSTGLDVEDNQVIIKRLWNGPDGIPGTPDDNLRTDSVGYDIDFKGTAKEHYDYVFGSGW